MVPLKTMKSGESFSLGILLPDDYILLYAQEIKIYIGGQECAHTMNDRMVKCELTSDYTATLFGDKEIAFWLDDMNWGVRKYPLGYIRFSSTSATAHNESVNTGYDVTISLSITESSITVTDIMYNYSKGDSSFQTWLQIPGNENKTWEDFVTFMQEPAAEATQAALDAAFTASLATTASLSATTSSILATESASLATQYSITATESSSLATQASILATESASLATQNAITATYSSSIATQASIIATESASLATQATIEGENARKLWEPYNNLKTYIEGNKVYYEGSSYYAKQTTTGNIPTDNTFWTMIVQKGDFSVVEFYVNENMELEQYTTSGIDIDFAINDNGELIVEYPTI